jgi:hypothetical protein
MEDIILSYSFTKKMSNNDTSLLKYISFLETSILYNKRFHQLRLYTDLETFELVKHLDVEIIIFNTDDFIFTDEFKVKLSDVIDYNEILIDPDIFLYEKLRFNSTCDIIVDHKDPSNSHYYNKGLERLRRFKIHTELNNYIIPRYVPNIGFLKINNNALKNEYLTLYDKLKKGISDEPDIKLYRRGFTIIFAQYVLGIVIAKGKYTVEYIRNDGNSYNHLAGPKKFKCDFTTLLQPLNKNKTLL